MNAKIESNPLTAGHEGLQEHVKVPEQELSPRDPCLGLCFHTARNRELTTPQEALGRT